MKTAIITVTFSALLASGSVYLLYSAIAPVFHAANAALVKATQQAGEDNNGKPINQR